MSDYPYTGSWRGLFWHRNHTGDLMAYFSAVFMFRLLNPSEKPIRIRIFEVVFYLLSLALVFGSRSATGIIVFGICILLYLFGSPGLGIMPR